MISLERITACISIFFLSRIVHVTVVALYQLLAAFCTRWESYWTGNSWTTRSPQWWNKWNIKKKINPVNFMSIQIWVFQLTSPTLHRVWRKYWPWYECIHLPVCFIIYCILSEIAFWYCLLYNYYWETWYQLNIYSDIFLFLADWYARLTFICCTKLTVLRSAIEKIYILVTYCLHLTALSEN